MCIKSQVQTRSEETGVCNHITLQDAFTLADIDKTVWKISFETLTGERVRLVKENGIDWVYRPLIGD